MNDGNISMIDSIIYEEPKTSSDSVLFFNYHEYLISNYKGKDNLSLIGNHFPNNYVTNKSEVFDMTRIIRIPRVYDINKYTDIIPQFSIYVPGEEPAALKSDIIQKYTPSGEFENNHFGSTSMAPLTPGLISREDFNEIITMINKLLFEAFNPHNIFNLIDNVLDFVTGDLYSKLYCRFIDENHSKKKLYELENYIEHDINLKLMSIDPMFQIISPRRNGYLSLDFQIPKSIFG